MPDDVGAKREVVALCCELLDGRKHQASVEIQNIDVRLSPGITIGLRNQ